MFSWASMLVGKTVVTVVTGAVVLVEETAVTVALVFAVSGQAIRSEVLVDVLNLLLLFDEAAQKTVVVEVFVVWVCSFCDDAAAKNRGLSVPMLRWCSEHNGSGEEFLVAAAEVLLEHGLVPCECAVCVFLHVQGVELALIWQPNVTSLGAASAGFGTVLFDRKVDLGAKLGLQAFAFDGALDCRGLPLFLEEENSVSGVARVGE